MRSVGTGFVAVSVRVAAVATALGLVACAGGTGPGKAPGPKVPSSPYELAVEAYVYAFPLLVFDRERQSQVNALGVHNQLAARTTTSTPFSKDVVAPSADTVSTTALLDLRNGPLVLSVPDSGKRYTRIDLLDAYTNVFASLGQRTQGNKAASFAIAGPNWSGDVGGVTTVHAPTNYVWLHGQVAAQGERDVPAASGLMRQWSLTPVNEFAAGKRRLAVERPPMPQSDGGAAQRVEALQPVKYFEEAARLLAINPPAPADAPLVKKFPSIGLNAKYGKFDPTKLKAETLSKAVNDGRARIHAAKPTATATNGWTFGTTGGHFGVDYLARAAAARTGISSTLPEDAVEAVARVDGSNRPLQGGSRYELHFAKSELPPVGAFWSLTMLDADGRMVDNLINRYAVRGDRLAKQGDGVTVYVQASPPKDGAQSNWLPAPNGPFQLVLRLYDPEAGAVNGTWKPPAVKRVD
jgi:hypothetical protein